MPSMADPNFGGAVVYISHRLEEIRRIGDRVTVLKDGRAVANGLPAKSTPTSNRCSPTSASGTPRQASFPAVW